MSRAKVPITLDRWLLHFSTFNLALGQIRVGFFNRLQYIFDIPVVGMESLESGDIIVGEE